MSVKRHAGYNLIGAVIPIILSLLTVPVYLKLVGQDRYGVLAIAWLLLGYFGLFDLGLGRATSFRIASLRDATPQERADTFWGAIAVNIGMGLIGGLILWIAAGYFFGHVFKVDEHLRPEMISAVPFLAASVPVATLMGVLTGAVQGRERFLEINIISVLSTTLFQLLPLFLAWRFGPNLTLLLSGALTARMLAAAALACRCRTELTRGQKVRVFRAEIVTLLKYGGWVNLTSIFGPALVILDRFAIGAILGAAAVSIYSVPFQLAQRIAVLPSSLTNALFPRMSAATTEERTAMGVRATRVLAGVMTPIVLGGILIFEPFLHAWVGAAMATKAAPVGRILFLGFWANAFALVPFVRLQASGRPDLVTKSLLAEIPPYLLALFFGMKYFGLAGCAFAFAGRCLLDFAVLTWVSGRKFDMLPLLAADFALLSLGVVASSRWSAGSNSWWIAAALLGLVTVATSWVSVPRDLRTQGFTSIRKVVRL